MYIVLARKYRPKNFKEVIGQPHITSTIENAIKSGRIAHAYLFSGPRGVGKTTVARIVAKSVNCEKGVTVLPCDKCSICNEITGGYSVDTIEIDGASNRGIDEVRELRENVKFSPTKSKYKVYIIDEVHMLTEPAFNALLKTLEEPPSHTIFILATTEPQKIPWTIASRCQHFHFNRITPNEIEKKMKEIMADEDIKVQDEALNIIAKGVEGSMRDALTVLDQLIAKGHGEVKVEDAVILLGIVKFDLLIEITEYIMNKYIDDALKTVDKMMSAGYDCKQFSRSLFEHFRNLLIFKICSKPEELINLSKTDTEKLKKQADKFSSKFEIMKMLNIIKELDTAIKYATQPRIILELYIAKLMQLDDSAEFQELTGKVKELEKKLESKVLIEEVPSKHAVPKEKITYADGEDKLIIEEIQDASHLNKFRNLWPEVLEKIKQKKPSAYGLLSRIKLVGISLRKISIEVESEFYKESLERQENRIVIDNIITEVYKRPFIIEWVVAKQGSARPKSGDSEESLKKESTIEIETVDDENEKHNIPATVKKALKIFGGRIIDKK